LYIAVVALNNDVIKKTSPYKKIRFS